DVVLRIAPSSTPIPIHWWPGEGSAGDAVGTAHGTTSASVGYEPGRFGQAFSISNTLNGDGTFASKVMFGTDAGNFGTGDFTVAFWVKTGAALISQCWENERSAIITVFGIS